MSEIVARLRQTRAKMEASQLECAQLEAALLQQRLIRQAAENLLKQMSTADGPVLCAAAIAVLDADASAEPLQPSINPPQTRPPSSPPPTASSSPQLESDMVRLAIERVDSRQPIHAAQAKAQVQAEKDVQKRRPDAEPGLTLEPVPEPEPEPEPESEPSPSPSPSLPPPQRPQLPPAQMKAELGPKCWLDQVEPEPEPEPEPHFAHHSGGGQQATARDALQRKIDVFLGTVPIGTPGAAGATSQRGYDPTALIDFAEGEGLHDATAEEIYGQFVEAKLAAAEAEMPPPPVVDADSNMGSPRAPAASTADQKAAAGPTIEQVLEVDDQLITIKVADRSDRLLGVKIKWPSGIVLGSESAGLVRKENPNLKYPIGMQLLALRASDDTLVDMREMNTDEDASAAFTKAGRPVHLIFRVPAANARLRSVYGEQRWVDKSAVKTCDRGRKELGQGESCHHVFGTVVAGYWERHNCRYCGYVFCSDCSTRRFPLVYIPVPVDIKRSPPELRKERVCDGCYHKLSGQPATNTADDDTADDGTTDTFDDTHFQYGLSLKGARQFLEKHYDQISEGMTTAEVCHTIVRPATVPKGWEDQCRPGVGDDDVAFDELEDKVTSVSIDEPKIQGSKGQKTIYVVNVVSKEGKLWSREARYSVFDGLRTDLVAAWKPPFVDDLKRLEFPGKQYTSRLRSASEGFYDERRQKLDAWLRAALKLYDRMSNDALRRSFSATQGPLWEFLKPKDPKKVKAQWYQHEYSQASNPACRQPAAPDGTYSYCEYLKRKQQETAGEVLVSDPTVFFSHAWSFPFKHVLNAMEAFVERQPDGSPPVYFWFDVFSIDQHSGQKKTQTWWRDTFETGIGRIGRTVMMLSPWDNPITLTRSWCLFELLCTHRERARFDICMGRDERLRFRAGLMDHPETVLEVFARIDVEKARAGEKKDQEMILAEARRYGIDKLNCEVVRELRGLIIEEAKAMAREENLTNWETTTSEDTVAPGTPRAGGQEQKDTIVKAYKIALLFKELGTKELLGRSCKLLKKVVDMSKKVYGEADTQTLAALTNYASCLSELGSPQQKREPAQIYQDIERRHEDRMAAAVGGGSSSALTSYGLTSSTLHVDLDRASTGGARHVRAQHSDELLATMAARLASTEPTTPQTKRELADIVEQMRTSGLAELELLKAQLALAVAHNNLDEKQPAIALFTEIEQKMIQKGTPRAYTSLVAKGHLGLLLDEKHLKEKYLKEAIEGLKATRGEDHPTTQQFVALARAAG